MCVRTWLFTLEKEIQAKISREEKYSKDASDRNEAGFVGQGMGKTSRKAQGQRNITHTLSLQNNIPRQVHFPTPNFLALLSPSNVSLPCIHY